MGTRFKDYRMRCGLTQKDVAEQSGIGLTTIHKFESGAADNLLSELPEFPWSIRLCFTRDYAFSELLFCKLLKQLIVYLPTNYAPRHLRRPKQISAKASRIAVI